MPQTEKAPSKRTRILYLFLFAIPVGGTLVVLWFLMGWWVLFVLIPTIWGGFDYLRRGDFFRSVEPVSRAGAYVPDALKKEKSPRE